MPYPVRSKALLSIKISVSSVAYVWKNVALVLYQYARMEVSMEKVKVKINGISVEVPQGTTILEAKWTCPH